MPIYLKGFRIAYGEERSLILRKWDFGGDTIHTNRAWNSTINYLRSLPPEAYPLTINDLDQEDSSIVTLKNREEFEYWLKHYYN